MARFGLRNELSAPSRLDNLSSTHAGLTAIEDLGDGGDLVLPAAFDHEEIGSATNLGAAGPFLEDVLGRIVSVVGCDLDATKALLARSPRISAGAGYLVHSNYSQHHGSHADFVPNGGPMLKVNANQRYATDVVGEALWLQACEAAGVPSQVFMFNNAMSCGSTIGSITATWLGTVTADVGIGLLSMHSAREMRGANDPYHLVAALRACLEGRPVSSNPAELSPTSINEWGVSKLFRLKLVEPSPTSVDERGVSKPFRLKLVEPTSERQRAGHVETTRRPSWYSRPRPSPEVASGRRSYPRNPWKQCASPPATWPKERKRPMRQACQAFAAERVTVVLNTCDQLCRPLKKP